jgi:hypothetical protein
VVIFILVGIAVVGLSLVRGRRLFPGRFKGRGDDPPSN